MRKLIHSSKSGIHIRDQKVGDIYLPFDIDHTQEYYEKVLGLDLNEILNDGYSNVFSRNNALALGLKRSPKEYTENYLFYIPFVAPLWGSLADIRQVIVSSLSYYYLHGDQESFPDIPEESLIGRFRNTPSKDHPTLFKLDEEKDIMQAKHSKIVEMFSEKDYDKAILELLSNDLSSIGLVQISLNLFVNFISYEYVSY